MIWRGSTEIEEELARLPSSDLMEFRRDSGGNSTERSKSAPINGSDIDEITQKMLTAAFAEKFGYFFSGTQSRPVNGAVVFTAGEDLMMFDTVSATNLRLNQYFQSVFRFSVSPGAAISFSEDVTNAILKDIPSKIGGVKKFSLSPKFSKESINSYFILIAVAGSGGQKYLLLRDCYVAMKI